MDLIVIRFPDGSREFRYPGRDLEEGDRIWQDGKRYRVLAVFSDDGHPPIVTVDLDSDDIGDLLGSERGGIELVPIG